MLQDVVRRPVTQSRQHYLRMRTPHTFRNLIELGIKDEHSMGYTELPGFRASIASAYTFYDVELEMELPLNLHPFAFMDVTYYGDTYLNVGCRGSLGGDEEMGTRGESRWRHVNLGLAQPHL